MIIIQRDSGYADKLRNYDIVLDGEVIDSIADGETKRISTKPGEHSLYLKLAWAKSNKITFRATKDETVHFTCASALRGRRIFLASIYAIIMFNRYSRLERVD